MKVIARAFTFALLACALAPLPVQAAEPEKVVVRNRKYASDGKFEVTANAGFAVATNLTNHTNFLLGFGYNLTENWELQVEGGYAISSHTDVADIASATIVKDDPKTASKFVDDFSNLWQMSWNVTAAVRWTPLYGKINIAGELPVHFQFYLLLGGGVGGMFRDSLVYCIGQRPTSGAVSCTTGDPGQSDDGSYHLQSLHEKAIKPVILGGFGMKLFFTDWLGIRVELRDMAFPDSYRKNINRALAGDDTGALNGGQASQGDDASSPGFTHLVFAQVGAVFTF
jgi:outer membrane beta-barrel protein